MFPSDIDTRIVLTSGVSLDAGTPKDVRAVAPLSATHVVPLPTMILPSENGMADCPIMKIPVPWRFLTGNPGGGCRMRTVMK